MDNWQITFALITALLTAGALFLGVNQYRATSAKLRLDLFERRLEVYNSTLFMTYVVGEGGALGDDELREFHRQRRIATFLYPPQIKQYLEALEARRIKIGSLRAEIQGAASSDERHRRATTELALAVEWMRAQSAALDGIFMPHLELASWQTVPFFRLGKARTG